MSYLWTSEIIKLEVFQDWFSESASSVLFCFFGRSCIHGIKRLIFIILTQNWKSKSYHNCSSAVNSDLFCFLYHIMMYDCAIFLLEIKRLHIQECLNESSSVSFIWVIKTASTLPELVQAERSRPTQKYTKFSQSHMHKPGSCPLTASPKIPGWGGRDACSVVPCKVEWTTQCVKFCSARASGVLYSLGANEFFSCMEARGSREIFHSALNCKNGGGGRTEI